MKEKVSLYKFIHIPCWNNDAQLKKKSDKKKKQSSKFIIKKSYLEKKSL